MSAEFLVRFWGTRGSIATPGFQKTRFGGNTTCIEMLVGDERLVFDAGTGIRTLGNTMLKEDPKGGHCSLFFSHTHWDHIQGFPFFGPAYHPNFSIDIYGTKNSQAHVRDLLQGQMQEAYFPVPFEALQGRINFREMAPGLTIGDATILSMAGVHPGGVTIYRVEAYGRSAIFCTDVELDLMLVQGGVDEVDLPHRFPPELLAFMTGADMIVIDCQYTDEEYLRRRNWGHPCVSTVVALVAQAKIRRAFMTHHDPDQSDEMVAAKVERANLQLSLLSPESRIYGAREGMVLNVEH
jgi:phosphoribosyl 1,2-cyclic phosphodiesterase